MVMLDICICTHNPNQQLFKIVLQALANQTLSKDKYQVWIVDNASDLPINNDDLSVFSDAGVRFNLLSADRKSVV